MILEGDDILPTKPVENNSHAYTLDGLVTIFTIQKDNISHYTWGLDSSLFQKSLRIALKKWYNENSASEALTAKELINRINDIMKTVSTQRAEIINDNFKKNICNKIANILPGLIHNPAFLF